MGDEVDDAGNHILDPDAVFDRFVEWVSETRGISLYPTQEEALLEFLSDSHVFLATPTGSGKTLVAYGALYSAIATGRRAVYTAPLKALVSEKFFDFIDIFGPENVGMVTGDVSVNAEAPIICCTAEILANASSREPLPNHEVDVVVMDEFHYYGDPDRGWAWQVPLLALEHTQFMLMSATLGDVSTIAEDLEQRTGHPCAMILGTERPVPLTFNYRVQTIHDAVREIVHENGGPLYIVHFAQAAAVATAQALSSLALVDKQSRAEIAETIKGQSFNTGFGGPLKRFLLAGIGVHHAGMLPKYRRLVEQLAQQGLLKIICGTDTLGVGINVPIRTVLLTSLVKFDGTRMRRLSAREFHQIAGRAGRAGYDAQGFVDVLSPEHEVEQHKIEEKALRTGKKPKHKASPPKGQVTWSKATFERLQTAEPEALRSQMRMTHGMMLDVLTRGRDALPMMERLIFGNHESRTRQFALAKRALAIYRTLRAADIVTVDDGVPALAVDVPHGFALNQPLSPFAIAAFELLDREATTYALDVISVIEATLEDPRAILSAQEHAARDVAIAAMKADGVEYEERMERLEEITYPKPLEELLTAAFEQYSEAVPWARDYELRPKSVVRDMIEHGLNFRAFVSMYGLQRSEGVVLRYLTDATRALQATVPLAVRDTYFDDVLAWLETSVRSVDASLMDEWQALMHDGDVAAAAGSGGAEAAGAPPSALARFTGIVANERAFVVAVRNAMFHRVELAVRERVDALGELDAESGWTATCWQEALDAYFAEYPTLGVDQDARSVSRCRISQDANQWSVRQVFADPNGDNDWGITATIDLAASDRVGEPVVAVQSVGPFGETD